MEIKLTKPDKKKKPGEKELDPEDIALLLLGRMDECDIS